MGNLLGGNSTETMEGALLRGRVWEGRELHVPRFVSVLCPHPFSQWRNPSHTYFMVGAWKEKMGELFEFILGEVKNLVLLVY